MGGCGSGNFYRFNTKKLTDDLLEICVFRMVKWNNIKEGIIKSGSLHWSRRGNEIASIGYAVDTINAPFQMMLTYTNTNRQTGEKSDMNYPVNLVTTKPNYGGLRWWFICPASGCGKRVAKLYGGKVFACRKCHDLAYPSQNETYAFRNLTNAQNIHRKLEGNLDWWGDLPPHKPKGMHQTTYSKHLAKLNLYKRKSYQFMITKFAGDPLEKHWIDELEEMEDL